MEEWERKIHAAEVARDAAKEERLNEQRNQAALRQANYQIAVSEWNGYILPRLYEFVEMLKRRGEQSYVEVTYDEPQSILAQVVAPYGRQFVVTFNVFTYAYSDRLANGLSYSMGPGSREECPLNLTSPDARAAEITNSMVEIYANRIVATNV